MRKKFLSLALTLALCLGLTIPAMAAGETTIQDDGGFSYTLSKPVVGTRFDDQSGITYYQIPEGTIITPVFPEGTVKKIDEYRDDGLAYILPNEGGVIFYEVSSPYSSPYGMDYAKIGDLEGMLLFDEATPTQPLRKEAGELAVRRFFSEEYDTHGGGRVYHVTRLYLEIVQDNGSTTPEQPQQPAGDKTASPSSDRLAVNGVESSPTVYNINDSNYFKIRDVAALLNGTEKQFSVGYDGEKQSVTATTGQGYDKLPSDLSGPPSGTGEARVSHDAIYVDGVKIEAEVYNINGNNYFKLRDLGKALNFYIGWTLERGVYIETDKPYEG
ncbi:MAG: hypothetical protein HFF58_07240 [Lawsonibacter sp.]|nr:hypothetical protein [Lawsonibacter sp.]